MTSEIETVPVNGNVEDVHVNGDVNGSVEPEVPAIVEQPQTSSTGTYDDLFPSLPGAGPSPVSGGMSGGMAAALARKMIAPARSNTFTKSFSVSADERRVKNSRFNDLSTICQNVMKKTNTKIEPTTYKDGTLKFLITGREDATSQAQRMLASEYQAQVTVPFSVPKDHHRIILGKAGKKLGEIEVSTDTKIQIPKQDDPSDSLRITGTREAIEKAMHEIKVISDEAFSRHIERVDVPKIYHPFIVGPFGKTLEALNRETGAKVNVPPLSVPKDEIMITGERNNVLKAKARVEQIRDEKAARTKTVSIEVKKPQHKYIVGPKGQTLNEIMEITGVSIEMPPTDSVSETITLRGEPEKLAKGLSVLYEKAHSETEDSFSVPSWIQRHILGPKGVNFQELSKDFEKVNVSFDHDEDRVRLSGPIAEVQKAHDIIQRRANEINEQLTIEEIDIADAKHIKFIVGKSGSNLKQIREETKATIHVVGEAEADERNQRGSKSNTPQVSATGSATFIRIEGTKDAVKKAKEELLVLVKKLENEVSYDLMIERRFYGQIIGAKGEKIKEIRAKFNEVSINFPEQNEKSDKVVIRGNKNDAEQCYKYLSQMNKELLANNHKIELPILKQLIQFLQGKDSLKNIREETGCRVDIVSEGASDMLVITGPRENTDKARQRIQVLQGSLKDMSSTEIMVPSKIHNYMLGAKGRNIKQIVADCGDVVINFPPEGSKSDRVTICGPKEAVTKAKSLLLSMSADYQTNNYSETIKAKVEHHRYLIGKNGSNINKLREKANVRINFASEGPNAGSAKDSDLEDIIITGKKEEVQKAREIIEEKIKELDQTVEVEMLVDPKFHHIFVARRAAVCRQIFEDFGGVNISFPPISDKTNERISLKGPKECIEAVKQKILDVISDFEAQVSIEVEIEPIHHRVLLGPRGKVNAIQSERDVRIKFPARLKDGEQPPTDEEGMKAARTVIITGRKENCEAARDSLLELVPISITMSVPFEFHRFIIGQKGAGVREMMDKCNVNIKIPPPTAESDEVLITGTKDAVEEARKEMEIRIRDLEGERADREAKSFQLQFNVDPIFHPKIIGKRGAVISKIRQKYDVQIQVPEARNVDPELADIITVTGYEEKTHAARDEILALVSELENLVTDTIAIDSKIHSRLIGSRGKTIREIMSQYSVEIKFPKSGENPDEITITGTPENVDECKEHLFGLADEYLDDIEVQYKPPAEFTINFDDYSANSKKENSQNKPKGGFVVKGGPWEKKGGKKSAESSVDTSSANEFPAFGASTNGDSGASAVWGKRN